MWESIDQVIILDDSTNCSVDDQMAPICVVTPNDHSLIRESKIGNE